MPRYTHNYWGVRNRFGILSETYSYLPFEDRVTTSRRFVEEVLGYAHANAAAMMQSRRAADAHPLVGQKVSLRSKEARGAEMLEILMGGVEEEVNPYSGRVMHLRANVRHARADVRRDDLRVDRRGACAVGLLRAGGAESGRRPARAHGIGLEADRRRPPCRCEEFAMATSTTTAQAFENHQERTVTGT